MDFDNNLSPVEPKSKWAVFLIFYQVCCYVEHWNQMENSLVIYGFNKDRERIEHLKLDLWSLLSGYCIILFVLNSAQSSGKNNWKCDSQELSWKKACRFACASLFKEKVSSWKRFDPEIYFVAILRMVIWHDWVSSLHARNEIGRGFCL